MPVHFDGRANDLMRASIEVIGWFVPFWFSDLGVCGVLAVHFWVFEGSISRLREKEAHECRGAAAKVPTYEPGLFTTPSAATVAARAPRVVRPVLTRPVRQVRALAPLPGERPDPPRAAWSRSTS